jgi:hypothetical protein
MRSRGREKAKSSRTRVAEQILLKLKKTLLYDFLEQRLLSGLLLTSKKNSALLMTYFLRTAVEVGDWPLLRLLAEDVLVLHLSLQDLYNEVLFISQLAFVWLVGSQKKINIGVINRLVTRLLSNVLEIKNDLQGNPSRVMKNQKNSFLPKRVLGRVARNSGDFNRVKLLGQYFVQIGSYLKRHQAMVGELMNVEELLSLVKEVRALEHKKDLKNIWGGVVTLWKGFLKAPPPVEFTSRIKRKEKDENIQFEKIENYVKRSLSKNKHKKVEFEQKERRLRIDKEEVNHVKERNKEQDDIASILTDMVYEESPVQLQNKKFKIRKLSNFNARSTRQENPRQTKKREDINRVNDFKKQTGNFRRARMFLKKRTGRGGGYVKGSLIQSWTRASETTSYQDRDRRRRDSIRN